MSAQSFGGMKMTAATDTSTIAIITACMRADGTPTFARTEVEVNDDQAENGVHYYLAEAELLQQGYEEPMVHFTESETPAFLFPAVERFLGVAPEASIPVLSEEP
jgi:hypothetical protein